MVVGYFAYVVKCLKTAEQKLHTNKFF